MRRWVAVVLLIACRKPYQADATMLGGGKYMIRAQLRAGESEGLAKQYAYQRANEVCPEGYLLDESDSHATPQSERVAFFGRRTVTAPEVVLMIRCGDRIALPDAGAPRDADAK
jgi:hypothetical protein